MARIKNDPKVQLNCRIPEDLAEKVRAKLQDPVRNKTRYGSAGELVTALLYAWLNEDTPLNKV